MSKLIKSLPSKDGFAMPAEFSEHEATWIIWPERPDNWRENAAPAHEAFAELANKIVQYEPVYMATSKAQLAIAKKHLDPKVKIVEMENDDSWVRDCGPTIVVNHTTKATRGVSWIFNAWGGKVDGLYSHWDKDQEVARLVCEAMHLDYYQADFVLEGGSIHTDGKGTLFVTEACLLSKGRNPQLTKQEIEQKLKDYLGVEKVIWLKHGVYQDETIEHVDNIMQISETGTILLHWTDDANDPQYAYSKAAYDLLTSETNALGEKFKVIKIPAPDPLVYITDVESKGVLPVNGTFPRKAGDRMAASYLNHYIGNKAVYIPKFHGKNDDVACEIIQTAYPSRKVVQIDLAREILLGGGNIHCITQQIPKLHKKFHAIFPKRLTIL